jgi:RHS repeat-associated protein
MTTYFGVYGSTENHYTLASETFAYDSLGNRTDLGFTSDEMNRYLTDADGNDLSYNARGDLTQTTAWDYTWDSLDRLTFAAPADHELAAEGFTYDFMNRLTSRSTYLWDAVTNDWCLQADSTIQFVYDGWMLVAKIDAATGRILQSYQWDPTKEAGVGGLLSETVYGTVGGTWQATATYVPVYDSNADVMAMVNQATGAVAATYTYSAFGTLLARTWNAAGDDPNDILFSSHMFDPGTGLIYMKERWYSPALGRFISADPSGEGPDANRQRYCGNNAIASVDAVGLAGDGHHVVGQALWKDARPEVQAFFDSSAGRITGQEWIHGGGRVVLQDGSGVVIQEVTHIAYNQEVAAECQRVFGKAVKDLTLDEAKTFLAHLKSLPKNSVIRLYIFGMEAASKVTGRTPQIVVGVGEYLARTSGREAVVLTETGAKTAGRSAAKSMIGSTARVGFADILGCAFTILTETGTAWAPGITDGGAYLSSEFAPRDDYPVPPPGWNDEKVPVYMEYWVEWAPIERDGPGIGANGPITPSLVPPKPFTAPSGRSNGAVFWLSRQAYKNSQDLVRGCYDSRGLFYRFVYTLYMSACPADSLHVYSWEQLSQEDRAKVWSEYRTDHPE